MLKKEIALLVKTRAQSAIAELDAIVADLRGQCSDEDFESMKRGVGLSIGKIITDVLAPVFEQHPEIDDLR